MSAPSSSGEPNTEVNFNLDFFLAAFDSHFDKFKREIGRSSYFILSFICLTSY